MSGGAPGNMHPAQVAEWVRQQRGDSPSVVHRPGDDPEAPAGWQPPPLPHDIADAITQGGGTIPEDLAAPGASPVASTGGLREEAPRRTVQHAAPEDLSRPAAPAVQRMWSPDIGVRGVQVLTTENGLVLDLLTDDGTLRLNEDESDQVLEVCVAAVQRGLQERLDALKQKRVARPKTPIDEAVPPA